jgi:hypothetical protein
VAYPYRAVGRLREEPMTSYVEPDRTQVLPLAPAEPAAPPAPVVPGSEGAVPSPAIPERSVDVIDEPTRIVPLNEPTQIVPIAVPNSAATARRRRVLRRRRAP